MEAPYLLPRLATIHPILVHVTLGVLPVILVAYAVAALRRSERWSFAGDVALWIGASVTLATAAFGLVSNAVLPWPGGLGAWRWSHLGFAAGTSVLFVGLAVWRFRASRRGERAGGGALAGIGVVALLYWVTGWIGGEVLVYRAGMAVEGAGRGALSPIASGRGSGSPPQDLHAAMARLRGSWALATTTFGHMLVERPSNPAYDRIAKAAIDLQAIAAWLGDEGVREIREHGEHEHGGEESGASPSQAAAAPDSGGDAHEHGDAAAQGTGSGDGAPGAVAQRAARALEQHAATLERAARARDWRGVAEALSGVTNVCASCHAEVRWSQAQ